MTAAFKVTLASTPKFVLVALCDSANDQGECYPSVKSLAEKCGMGERTVQQAIASLEEDGFLRREFRVGRSTTYLVDPRSSRTPADCAPITVNEPSIEPKTEKTARKRAAAPDTVPAESLVAAGFDGDTAAEFIAHKTAKKAPLTARAWADHLRESQKAGWSPMQAAEKVMAKNWAGFEAKYVTNDGRPAKAGKHTGFESKDYRQGVEADGSLA